MSHIRLRFDCFDGALRPFRRQMRITRPSLTCQPEDETRQGRFVDSDFRLVTNPDLPKLASDLFGGVQISSSGFLPVLIWTRYFRPGRFLAADSRRLLQKW